MSEIKKIDTDKLLKAVAKEHGLVLDANDPVMALMTLNRLVLESYVERIEEALEKSSVKQAKALDAHLEQAKKTSEEIITKAATYASEQAKQQFLEFQKELHQSTPSRPPTYSYPLLHPANRVTTVLLVSVCVGIGALLGSLLT